MSKRPVAVVTHTVLEPAPTLLKEAAEVRFLPRRANHSVDELRQAAESATGMLTQLMDGIDDTVLSAPGLKIVSNIAVGYDNIDVAAATKRGVMVTNTPGVLDDTTADFAFTLLMAAARRLGEADRFVRGGQFKGWAIDMLLGHDIFGATLGIVGFGRIGRGVTRRARGFDMRVLYYDEQPAPAEVERDLGVTRVDFETLLEEADFVSLHVPLTPGTLHLISTPQLERMKPTAVLVNSSRGPVVDEAALAAALKAGKVFAAGLDVYEKEPAVNSELLKLENVVLAPHIASASVKTRSRMCELAARNLLAGIAGERPPNLVNPEVLDR